MNFIFDMLCLFVIANTLSIRTKDEKPIETKVETDKEQIPPNNTDKVVETDEKSDKKPPTKKCQQGYTLVTPEEAPETEICFANRIDVSKPKKSKCDKKCAPVSENQCGPAYSAFCRGSCEEKTCQCYCVPKKVDSNNNQLLHKWCAVSGDGGDSTTGEWVDSGTANISCENARGGSSNTVETDVCIPHSDSFFVCKLPNAKEPVDPVNFAGMSNSLWLSLVSVLLLLCL